LVPAGGQRSRREGLCLARHRLVRARGADRLGLRPRPGLRPHDGLALRAAEPRDRHPLRAPRRTPPARGMSGRLPQGRYVVGENPVTLAAFSLFLAIVVLALAGPWIAPFDPLLSDTTRALQPPSRRHWFGTDQIGRDVLSRILVATRLDFAIALSAVAI